MSELTATVEPARSDLCSTVDVAACFANVGQQQPAALANLSFGGCQSNTAFGVLLGQRQFADSVV